MGIIIEADGGFHKIPHSKSVWDLKEIKFADAEKERLANEHNIEVIRINCERSSLAFIKNNILQSRLNGLIDLNLVDWGSCHAKSMRSKMLEVQNLYSEGHSLKSICEIVDLSYSSVASYIRTGKKDGVIPQKDWHDVRRKVFCTTTSEYFNSLTEASKKYRVKADSISLCCRGLVTYAGQLDEKTKLVWEFVTTGCERETNNKKYMLNRKKHHGRQVTFNGETKGLADFGRDANISYSALHKRIKRGWSIERALSTPLARQTLKQTSKSESFLLLTVK